MESSRIVIAAIAFAAFAAGQVNADIKPHPLFCDNMVLQQGIKALVWGTADPGEKLTVSIAGQTAEATADKAGSWMIRLTSMTPGGPTR